MSKSPKQSKMLILRVFFLSIGVRSEIQKRETVRKLREIKGTCGEGDVGQIQIQGCWTRSGCLANQAGLTDLKLSYH